MGCCAAASHLLISAPPPSRSVLQSVNPAEPHKDCPNPKPGISFNPTLGPQQSYASVTLIP